MSCKECEMRAEIHIETCKEYDALEQQLREAKEFIQDCSVSHVESRYKHRAKLLIKNLQKG